MGLIGRLASGADVPVYVVVGSGGRAPAAEVSVLPGVRLVDSPRSASILLVVGQLTRELIRPASTVHDQMASPRSTVWWPGDSSGEVGDLGAVWPGLVHGRPGDAEGLRRIFAELVTGARPSDPPLLADVDPAPWRGLGPYGQGGTGMTGGVPFGRPLPGRAPDPDGLELDQLPLHIGPFFPLFPPGLVLDVALQGDVVRSTTVGDNPFLGSAGDPPPGPLDTAAFVDALATPTKVGDLELARARHHVHWLAGALRLHGLGALALRVARLAAALGPGDRSEVEALARRLARSRSLASATAGIGVLPVPDEDLPPGPVARAAGGHADARSDDPAYQAVGFEPVVGGSGDARARMRQRLAEAVQSLDLAERAGDALRLPGPAVEGPRGPLRPGSGLPSSALLDLLPAALAGQEWGDAMTAVVSLDLDVEEAAVGQLAGVGG